MSGLATRILRGDVSVRLKIVGEQIVAELEVIPPFEENPYQGLDLD